MTFELTRIKQRLADLEKNQDKLLKIIGEVNLTIAVIQKQIFILQAVSYTHLRAHET